MKNARRQYPIAAALQRLLDGRHDDPFALLGSRDENGRSLVRVHLPDAAQVTLVGETGEFSRIAGTEIFEWQGNVSANAGRYRLRWTDTNGRVRESFDPYSFPTIIPAFDLHLFAEGRHLDIHRWLGAHVMDVEGVTGVLFATWAPHAERVSVVGTFNDWDGRRNPMRRRDGDVWELFLPELSAGAIYKFEIRNRDSGDVFLKSDPYAQACELRPETASVTVGRSAYRWSDSAWIAARRADDWRNQPISIYEVHLGSWQRSADGGLLDYRSLAKHLVEYVRRLGFTHIELLPITEHPYDPSWGYQATGLFAPTSRFGSPDDFRFFVDHCHRHGIGVILDWVPAHFPRDDHALAGYDGAPLYEHADPRRGAHSDWGTLIYDYGYPQVAAFLMASAMHWLGEYHLDGLRVDAVASMLHRDYSRKAGEWTTNSEGGRENLEAVDFLRDLNRAVHGRFPGALMIAEESTTWPMVSRPVEDGGLGFSMKWNMGWMHDTLEFFRVDPVHRGHALQKLSFGMTYAYSENFMLALSHDEVVHGKSPMVGKMPGDERQRFANLRLLYLYQWTQPGKKLLFMGCEFADTSEWDHDRSLNWSLAQYPLHAGMQRLVGALNDLYVSRPALHRDEFSPCGFQWLDCDDRANAVLSYLRRGGNEDVVVVLNLGLSSQSQYCVGVPTAGAYRIDVDTNSQTYGGDGAARLLQLTADDVPHQGQPYSLRLTLPALTGVVLRPAKSITTQRVVADILTG